VRVDVPVRLVLLPEVAQQLHDDSVFQDVGVIACVESVAVTKHGNEGASEEAN
jgi:hypothetical protein